MIRTYANTKAELNIAEDRLHLLMAEKEELYTKYFSMAAKIGGDAPHTNKVVDIMAEYMAELTRVRPSTGMSLDEELEKARNKVGILNYYLKRMEMNLKNTAGIENELFTLIVVDGLRPTKAVRIVAERHNKEEVTIWKYHYPKIKKEISKCIVNV